MFIGQLLKQRMSKSKNKLKLTFACNFEISFSKDESNASIPWNNYKKDCLETIFLLLERSSCTSNH